MLQLSYLEMFPDPLNYEQNQLLEWPVGSCITEVYVCCHHRFKDKNGEQHHKASWEWLYQRSGFSLTEE